MAVESRVSLVISTILTVLLFSGMQMYKSWLSSTQLHTVLGGFIGSLVFLFLLTAMGNFESIVFGKSFQMKLFPEVFLSLLLSMIASGLVHRVATTTCFLFSIMTLYYLNRISQEIYSSNAPQQVNPQKKKK